MIVGKAFLNTPPRREPSGSQLALEALLERRRQRYQARRRDGGDTGSSAASMLLLNSSDGALHFPVDRIRDEDDDRRSCISHLVALRLRDKAQQHEALRVQKQKSRSFLVRRVTKLEDASCEELAERVVSQAKVRLKRQKRAANVLQKIYQPKTTAPAGPAGPAGPATAFRTSTPINSKSTTPKSLSPAKAATDTPERPNRSLRLAEGSREHPVAVRKVVYWSERQSNVEKDSGVPCVPPSTPKQDQEIKFVPSMSDIKSQRDLKNRLQSVNVKQQEAAEKEQSVKMEKAKREKRDATARLKARQRAEIYALNKVMAELERRNFENFMSGKV